MLTFFARLLIAFVTCGAAVSALAQSDYPARPVKMVVAFAAGGPVDLSARIVAEALTRKLGQPFVVENRTGANGAIAAEAVKTSAADGHTILISNASMITITPTLVRSLRYHPKQDFAAVTRIVQSPLILVVNPADPRTSSIRDVGALIEAVRTKPDAFSYGSAGLNGNVQQIAFELLADKLGVKLLGIPYKGSAEAQMALLSQQITLLFDTPTSIPYVQEGRLRALATATRQRLPSLPDVPTLAQAGLGDVEIGFWSGVFVPKGTPATTVERLASAISEISQDPSIRARLEPLGAIAVSTPHQFGQLIDQETASFAQVIERAGLVAQ